MTKRPMTEDDYLEMMSLNADVYPEFTKRPEAEKRFLATYNIVTGPAEALVDGDKLLAVGGIRCCGIGEAWAVIDPEFRAKQPKELVRACRETLKEHRDRLNLWRIFAECSISENFLKHLQFVPARPTLIWTRKAGE